MITFFDLHRIRFRWSPEFHYLFFIRSVLNMKTPSKFWVFCPCININNWAPLKSRIYLENLFYMGSFFLLNRLVYKKKVSKRLNTLGKLIIKLYGSLNTDLTVIIFSCRRNGNRLQITERSSMETQKSLLTRGLWTTRKYTLLKFSKLTPPT